jgi:hypothetical protein
MSLKIQLVSTLMFEEFSGVDINLETKPLLMDSAMLESITEPRGELRSHT